MIHVLSRKVSEVAECFCKASPHSFGETIPSTEDAGRVILGGGYAGVSVNNEQKIRVDRS